MSNGNQTPAPVNPDGTSPWWERIPIDMGMSSRMNVSPELMRGLLQQMSQNRSSTSTSATNSGAVGYGQLEGAQDVMTVEMEDPEPAVGAQSHPHSHENGPARVNEQPQWRHMAAVLQKSGIFFLLVLLKFASEHLLGLLLFCGLVGTFWHADSLVVSQIALRESKRCGASAMKLLWVVSFCCLDVGCIYYFFSDQKLYRSLYWGLPEFEHVDFVSLLWTVLLTDYVVKFSTVAIKAALSLLPFRLIPYKRRGKYYCLCEELSQLYRLLLPARAWFTYLTATDASGWFSVLLFVIYFVAKVNLLWMNIGDIKSAFRRAAIDVNYGLPPRPEELQAAGENCPICHDTFADPVVLSCTHVFCEDCVAVWFDRERSCPMCRATIADDPKYRNGSTSSFVQFF